MKKISVAVLSGGPSAEHTVSLHTGKMVVRSLLPRRYRVTPIIIRKNGIWVFPVIQKTSKRSYRLPEALIEIRRRRIQVVFIALHGTYGEDGTLQAALELAGFPYTGSGVLASALGMDKVYSSELFTAAGLCVPKYISFSNSQWIEKPAQLLRTLLKTFRLPVVVKPRALGSSVGVSIPKTQSELRRAIQKTFKVTDHLIVQAYIAGREVTCGVLDRGRGEGAFALPPTEIVPNAGPFFDYQAKYEKGGSEEITPARFPETMIKKIQSIALRTHELLGCSGMSRTDMIVSSRQIFVLEINTIPGMTETSLLPQAAQVAHISFPALLDRLIRAARR
jgi:D-alanine-D-alanine ligase